MTRLSTLVSWACVVSQGLALAGCSRGPSPTRAKAAEAPELAPASTEESAAQGAEDAGMASHAESEADDARKKEDAEPSLSQPPPGEALGPDESAPSERGEVERLESEKRQFQTAIDPEALSCAGALPRRDAICSLAKKICELTKASSLSAQKDCEKAQSACTNAKATYKSRCGG